VNKLNFDKLDKIYLNRNDVEKIFEWDRVNHHKYDSVSFPLTEGLIYLEEHSEFFKVTLTSITYFKIDESGIIFRLFDESDRKEMLSFKLDLTIEKTGDVPLTNFKNYLRNAREEDYKGQALMSTQLLLCLFQYMTHVTEHVVEKKETKTIAKKVKSKKSSGNNKNRYVKINTVSYSFDYDKDRIKNKYERQALAWTVRGHWRHYRKTGKTVWIKPHVKGEGEVTAKNYKI
jgi:hypothetical protein